MSKTPETSTHRPAFGAGKKVSRRDAIKILTAVAGATALANTPARWSKPELKVGVLPVHAQTSITPIVHTLQAGLDEDINMCNGGDMTSTVIISPADAGILMSYAITADLGITINSPAMLNGVASTNATGTASLLINATTNDMGSITVLWGFANSTDGTGTDSQAFTNLGC